MPFTSDSTKAASKQKPWLLGLLFLTVLATVFTALDNDPPIVDETMFAKPSQFKAQQIAINSKTTQLNADSKQHDASSKASAAKPDHGLLAQIQARTFKPIRHNLFSSQSWAPPPYKVARNAIIPLPSPVAPPVPFIYIGKLEEEREVVYFLLQQNRLINLKAGQSYQGQWRLDSEDAHHLNWTFLPLDLTQTLPKEKNQMHLSVPKDAFVTAKQLE